MKKRNLLLVATMLLCATLAMAGNSLAYFSSTTSTLTNVITTGRVDITLTEEGWENEQPRPLAAGEELDKRPIVTNTGSLPCWVRVRINLGSDTVALLRSGNLQLVGMDKSAYTWKNLPTRWESIPAGKGVELTAILNKELLAGKTAPPVFTGVALSKNYRGDGSAITIAITAEAVQMIPEKTAQTCWEVF